MQERRTRRPGDRMVRLPRIRPWRVIVREMPQQRAVAFSPLLLVYGFVGLIAVGTVLLVLPVSSRTGDPTPFVDALFTATSAVCVTGLVVVDTADYWSGFGQGVVLVLIQLGGFGFMTSATLFLLALGRRIGLRERMLIGQSMGLSRLGGLIRIVREMAIFTVVVEVAGVILFSIRFWGEASPGAAIWRSVFHSISAFNNAGFDLSGGFRSLADYQSDPTVLLLTALFIVLGGISYLVVIDVLRTRRLARLSLDTKLVLVTTATLLVLGTAIMLVTEFADPDTLGPLSVPQKLLNAFFQSVTARTAGFSAVNMANLADYALFFTMLLMFVGGASGSTAGGIKVNTFGLLGATVWSMMRGSEHPGAFGRDFASNQVYRGLAVVVLALGFLSVVVLLLTVTEESRFLDIVFESVSAFGTVGLSTGVTPHLSVAGRVIITVTMFVGRLGPLALGLSLIERQRPARYGHPTETVRIG